MGEDHALQGACRLRRLEPPQLVERAACGLVRVERLLLAAGTVQREHQEPAEPLAFAVLRGERGRRRDRVVVLAELDLGLDPVLERGKPQLVEAGDLVLEERLVREIRECRAAPECERVAEDAQPLGRGQRLGVVDEPLEPVRVDRAGIQPEHVAGRAGLDRLPAEHSAQSRDGVLDDRLRGRWRRTAPEVVDDRVHRDDRADVEDELCEESALSRATEREPCPGRPGFERPEDENLHLRVPLRRIRRRYSSARPKSRVRG